MYVLVIIQEDQNSIIMVLSHGARDDDTARGVSSRSKLLLKIPITGHPACFTPEGL